jgi:hypothetical protein
MSNYQSLEGAGRHSGRQPYERPRVIFREPIEVMTAICDPSPLGKTDLALCPSAGPPQS